MRMAMSDPGATFRNNIVGFAELLEKLDQQKLLYASSSSVYSGVAGNPVDEHWSSFSVGNIHDFSKYADDCLAGFSGKQAIGHGGLGRLCHTASRTPNHHRTEWHAL